jgi:hypothetical protein
VTDPDCLTDTEFKMTRGIRIDVSWHLQTPIVSVIGEDGYTRCPVCGCSLLIPISVLAHIPEDELVKNYAVARHDRINPRCPLALARTFERIEPILNEMFREPPGHTRLRQLVHRLAMAIL